MITLNNINLSSIDLSGIDLRGIKLGLGGRGGGSSDGFPVLPGDVTRWHFGGLTNEMMAAMDDPRIEDADGKGRFLSFKNFAWGGMSGVGGYTENYNSNKWYKVESRIDATWTYKSFNARSIKDNRLAQLFYQSSLSDTGFRVLSCTIKVSGLTDGQGIEYVSNGTQQFVIMRIENDGIYHLPSFDFGAKNAYYGFRFLKLQESCNITIEQLPLYPGFILGDGVDDFAVTEKELNFEDTYTVYTAFIPFQNDPANNMVLCGKNHLKDFYITYSDLNRITFYSAEKLVFESLSKGFNILCCKRTPDKMVIKNLITDKSSEILANDLIDNPGLYYLWKSAVFANYAKAAIAGQIIDNGHFTTDEEDENILNWHKKQYPWLFPDQAWTVVGKTNEDEDRATIANITGNGNDLVLSNFGFAEGSGYNEQGEYAGYLVTDGVDDIASSNTIIYEADFTFIGEWKFIQKDDTVAGINSSSHLYIQNRYNRGATIMINSTFESKKNITDYMTFKAITSKGKAYDENWNEVDLLYGDGYKGPSGVNIGGQGGTEFCHMIFKNMALYMNKVFSKDECIKAYNYLQTLKSK